MSDTCGNVGCGEPAYYIFTSKDDKRKMILCRGCGDRARSGEGAKRYTDIERIDEPEEIEWTGEPQPAVKQELAAA